MNKKFVLFVASALLLSGANVFAQFSPKKTRSGTNSEWVVNFFRVSNPNERFYEDANSEYSKGRGMNFLGIEGKGDEMNTAMLVKYTRGKVMPQYMIMLGRSVNEGYEYICPICNDPECTHSKIEVGYTTARFLVNLSDSVEYYKGDKDKQDKFLWNKMYTRLAFVEGKMYGDSVVVIESSAKDPKENRINVVDVDKNGEGAYSPILFSFRLLQGDEPDGDFLIESSGKNIASTEGQWIKIQNGVPVIVDTTEDGTGIVKEAEAFNLEYTENDPVPNIGLNPTSVQITGGQGTVTIKGAQGKSVTINNTLGQILVKKQLDSDEVTINVPSGVAIVAIEGKASTKVLVK